MATAGVLGAPFDFLFCYPLLELTVPYLAIALKLQPRVFESALGLLQPGLKLPDCIPLFLDILLECPGAVVHAVELLFEAAGLDIDIACFAADVCLALRCIVSLLLQRGDAGGQRALDALPVFGCEGVLSLQCLDLAEELSLRRVRGIACRFFGPCAKEFELCFKVLI